MDFFEAQARARRRTTPLVVLFILAVIGTIVALYLVYVAGAGIYGVDSHDDYERIYQRSPGELLDIRWWQPDALKIVALLVIPTVTLPAAWKWWRFRAGGSAVAEDVGGVRIFPDTRDPRERQLMNVVEEMSLASGLPVPAVYVLPDEAAINAFAAGYSQADAAVAVTRGSLERLTRDELQGVLAHEFSHILNGDMRLNTRLVALLYGILALVLLGRGLMRLVVHSSSSRHDSDRKGDARVAIPLLAAGAALYVIGGIGFLFGRLIQAAVSRQREYLADASAVQFTRNPGGIAGALKKIGALAFGGRFAHAAAGEVSHFCFAQNFRTDFAGLFATHPPLEARIRAIEPAFDGKFPPLPPLSPEAAARAEAATRPYRSGSDLPPPLPRAAAPFAAGTGPAGRGLAQNVVALVATAGALSLDTLAAARAQLDEFPETLREAARDPARVAALAYALCQTRLAPPAAAERARALVATHAGAATAGETARLHAELDALDTDLRLPLLQLAAPALRQLDAPARDLLFTTLDALVHADGRVSPHEFALQKILARDLHLAERPRDALSSLAPGAVTAELSLALSVAARLDAADDAAAAPIFARAAAGFNGFHSPLAYVPAERATLGHLDRALDRLALAPPPFRRRVLIAFGQAFSADGTLSADEVALLRAVAAALDCPIPPALGQAA